MPGRTVYPIRCLGMKKYLVKNSATDSVVKIDNTAIKVALSLSAIAHHPLLPTFTYGGNWT